MCNVLVFAFFITNLVSSPVVTREASDKAVSCRGESTCLNGPCASEYDVKCQLSQNDTDNAIARQKRATAVATASRCILPPQPSNGLYTVSGTAAAPGTALPSTELAVYCRPGYGIAGTVNGIDGVASQRVFCIDGSWSQPMPRCVRFCKLEADPSISYTCHVPGAGFKACSKFVPPGQSVRPSCNRPAYYSTDSLLAMKCVDGFWDYIAKCKADCGRITPEGEVLVIDGRPAKRGELPWHVGVYRKNPYSQICGGSLISNNIVLSAGHCFWDDITHALPPDQYAVAIGKLYRDWDHANDVGAQKSDVKEIKLPVLFQGGQANFQEDLALLVLSAPFDYKPHVRPVCLNFDSYFDGWQLREGSVGKVAGWGLTSADGEASPVLRVVDYPYVDSYTCINTLPASFREYITADKFCAGYTNGTALCHGDSGGGLAFADKERGVERYYLRGVISAAPSTDLHKCNDAVYTTFTKISKHEEFIKQWVAANTRKTCLPYLFQCKDGACVDQGADCNGIKECADGSDEAAELCDLAAIANNNTKFCVLPPYPVHGTYRVEDVPDAAPGQTLDTARLVVTCEQGSYMETPDGKVIESNNQVVFCDNRGVWYQPLNKCVWTAAIDPLQNWGPAPARPAPQEWLEMAIDEIFGARDFKPDDPSCTKVDGTSGRCVPYYICNEQLTYDDTSNTVQDPCVSGLDVCCATANILAKDRVRAIA